jgi:ATP-dependent Clp protease adaptor protein ClpS
MDRTITTPRVTEEVKPARPKLHNVILLNDHYTPRAFVVRAPTAEFRMGEGTAQGMMLTAHRLGSRVVAVFTKEVAEEKATRATDMARRGLHADLHD